MSNLVKPGWTELSESTVCLKCGNRGEGSFTRPKQVDPSQDVSDWTCRKCGATIQSWQTFAKKHDRE